MGTDKEEEERKERACDVGFLTSCTFLILALAVSSFLLALSALARLRVLLYNRSCTSQKVRKTKLRRRESGSVIY